MVCSICGRKLRSSKSLELGYGPVCYKKTYGSTKILNRRKKESPQAVDSDPEQYNIPGQMTIAEFLEQSEKI